MKTLIGILTIGGSLLAIPERGVAQPFTPPSPTARAVIRQHPNDAAVLIGGSVTFGVVADNPDVTFAGPELGYQWQTLTAGTMEFVNIGGATGTNLTLTNLTVSDAALFRVKVKSDNGVTISEVAALLVYKTNSPLTYFGVPLVSGGGSGTCPGPYVGYVNYRNGGLGWAPDHTGGNTNHSATNSRDDTKLLAIGYANDTFCAIQTVLNTHTGAPPPEDTRYRFTIYFPTNVPTTNWPITLTGFLP